MGPFINGAVGETRTRTIKDHYPLKIACLPIPPRPLAAKKNKMEGAPGFEPGNKGFADLCLTTWLCSQAKIYSDNYYFKMSYLISQENNTPTLYFYIFFAFLVKTYPHLFKHRK